MRQDPIEIAMAGMATRTRAGKQRGRSGEGVGPAREPGVVDEAFARFDGPDRAMSGRKVWDRQMMRQTLVSDLAAQLEAIDRQRERLAQLLQSIEANSIAE